MFFLQVQKLVIENKVSHCIFYVNGDKTSSIVKAFRILESYSQVGPDGVARYHTTLTQ